MTTPTTDVIVYGSSLATMRVVVEERRARATEPGALRPGRGARRDDRYASSSVPDRRAPSSRDPRGTPKEACGVVGVYAPGQPVSHLTYLALYALQHRGQEAAGMAVSDGAAAHRRQGPGPGLQRLRRPHAAHAPRPPGDRPHPLLDDRLVDVAQRPAGLAGGRRPAVRPRPQRQPHQHRAAGGRRRHAARHRQLRLRPRRRAARRRARPPRRRARRPTTCERALLAVLPRLEGAFSFVLADEDHVIARPRPARVPAAVPRPPRRRAGSSPRRRRRSTSSAPPSSASSTPARCS